VGDDGARLVEGELHALHGPHYDAPQDGETKHAGSNRMSRMSMCGQRARAHVSSRAGAHSAERDDASIALPRVAGLPLRADVRLATRQQRIADELREECRQWSVPFDAIALDVLQPKWGAWNQWRRQESDQAKARGELRRRNSCA
jgi:hypothetical protein